MDSARCLQTYTERCIDYVINVEYIKAHIKAIIVHFLKIILNTTLLHIVSCCFQPNNGVITGKKKNVG